jgi:hypothetical protein
MDLLNTDSSGWDVPAINFKVVFMSVELQKIKARILESKIKEEAIAYQYGNEAGKAWVTKDATYSELERLSELCDAMSMLDVVNAITGGEFDTPEYVGLGSAIDESTHAEQIMDGFIYGALKLYREAMAA